MEKSGKIFESPDGGRTVYQRAPGSIDRTLTDESVKYRNAKIDELLEDQLWRLIRTAAKTNTALQDALDRVKVIYELSKDNG